MTRYFFYGLFMDRKHLQAQGFHPSPPVPAMLEDFEIFIGDQASLVLKAGEVVYGTLMDFQNGEVDLLYAVPGLEDYKP